MLDQFSSSPSRATTWLASVFFLLAGCGEPIGAIEEIAFDDGGRPKAQPRTIDIRRTLVVTEQPILDRFSFERTMTALASQSGVPGLTATGLFQQLWDTQNPAPGLGAGAHCNDQVDGLGAPQINGFPYTCRGAPSEGAESTCDPFAPESPCAYIPIGLFNRYDLAPADGAHCGEYRIVYARASGITTTSERNLLIFEAYLPNPHVIQGIKGCKKIIEFWADLSDTASITERADDLEDFYYDGIANVDRVVDITHFGDNALGAGQLRTNQFLQTSASPRAWSLREFKMLRTCSGNACTAMRFSPVTNKNNPWGGLFDPASTHAQASAFRTHFLTQVDDLVASSSLTAFQMSTTDTFNSALSEASGSTDTNYMANFGALPSAFRTDIDTAVAAAGSTLTADDVVRRAQAHSCAGCHRLSNNVSLGGGLTWPPSLGFTHVTERETEVVDGVTRFRISDALVNVFLPHRKAVFEDYLNDRPRNTRGPHWPIGDMVTH
jgi:hypothetical protein